jgi:predicted DCC family thiol-disulfide oxidoreductase YuxK
MQLGRSWVPVGICDVPDGLILFDGVCLLCSWWVRFVIERDAAAKFRFVPVQSPYGRCLAQSFGIDPDSPETNAVVIGGYAYFKSDGAIEVLGHLPHWSWTGVFRILPRPMRDWLYDRVAGNRYRLFGKTESCLVPMPDIARRFLFESPNCSKASDLAAGRRSRRGRGADRRTA